MGQSRPFGRIGQALFVASTLCTVTSNGGFASAREHKPYVLMDMYQPIAKSKQPLWQYKGIGNENLYDVGGLLRFLYAEVLGQEGKDPERLSRGHGIDTIAVWHLKVYNPPDAVKEDHQWEFAPFMKFKDGALVDDDGGMRADTALERLATLGDQVGLQAFRQGSADPRFAWEGTYYEFSVPGPCPNLQDKDRGSIGVETSDKRCLRYKVRGVDGDLVQGASCKVSKKDPDGGKGCVVVVEDVDIIELDKLVGITEQDCGTGKCRDFADFHQHCTDSNLQVEHNGRKYCREYHAYPECSSSCHHDKIDCKASCDSGLEFWRGRCNVDSNLNRLQAILASQFDAFQRLLRQHLNSPPCSTIDYCSKPDIYKGIGYCHRDISGVCGSCFVPGTIDAASPPEGQPKCRQDLFTGDLKEYAQANPICSASCTKCEDLSTAEEACCISIGKCVRSWKLGEWSECSAKCGRGEKTRKVWCPFNLDGGCASPEPSSSEECSGDQCPWDSDSGEWEPCDNPCGLGSHSKRLVCPLVEGGGCDGAEKPRPVERQCYGTSTRHDYCRQCSEDDSKCLECIDDFILTDKGYCVNRFSFAEVSFHVNTAAGRLLERSDIFANLESAIPLALSDTDVVASTIDMAVLEDETTNSGHAVVRIQLALRRGQDMEQEDYQEALTETVEKLSRLKERVGKMEREGPLAKTKIATEMRRQFSAGLSAILGIEIVSSSFRRFCPNLREWREDTFSCGETPRFLLSDDLNQASGDSENAHQHLADTAAYEGSQRVGLAADLPHIEEKVVQSQDISEEGSLPHIAESRKENKLMVWAIAGGSLGCALASGLTIIVAVSRRKRG